MVWVVVARGGEEPVQGRVVGVYRTVGEAMDCRIESMEQLTSEEWLAGWQYDIENGETALRRQVGAGHDGKTVRELIAELVVGERGAGESVEERLEAVEKRIAEMGGVVAERDRWIARYGELLHVSHGFYRWILSGVETGEDETIERWRRIERVCNAGFELLREGGHEVAAERGAAAPAGAAGADASVAALVVNVAPVVVDAAGAEGVSDDAEAKSGSCERD